MESVEKLQRDIKRLQMALAWYADEDNFDIGPLGDLPAMSDGGARARAALAWVRNQAE